MLPVNTWSEYTKARVYKAEETNFGNRHVLPLNIKC